MNEADDKAFKESCKAYLDNPTEGAKQTLETNLKQLLSNMISNVAPEKMNDHIKLNNKLFENFMKNVENLTSNTKKK